MVLLRDTYSGKGYKETDVKSAKARMKKIVKETQDERFFEIIDEDFNVTYYETSQVWVI